MSSSRVRPDAWGSGFLSSSLLRIAVSSFRSHNATARPPNAAEPAKKRAVRSHRCVRLDEGVSSDEAALGLGDVAASELVGGVAASDFGR